MANLRLVMAYVHHGFESHILCKAANNISFFVYTCIHYVYTRIHEKKTQKQEASLRSPQKKYFLFYNI